MLMPKKTKYRKPHKVNYDKDANSCNYIAFGKYGLQAIEGGWVTNKSIESARIVLARHLHKKGKMWIRIFPHMSMTKKPIEVRMGSGKGSPEVWVAVVKRNTMIFELDDIPYDLAKKILLSARHKLPVKCIFVEKKEDIKK